MKKLIQARTDTPTLHANKNQIAQIVKDKEKKSDSELYITNRIFVRGGTKKKKTKKFLNCLNIQWKSEKKILKNKLR